MGNMMECWVLGGRWVHFIACRPGIYILGSSKATGCLHSQSHSLTDALRCRIPSTAPHAGSSHLRRLPAAQNECVDTVINRAFHNLSVVKRPPVTALELRHRNSRRRTGLDHVHRNPDRHHRNHNRLAKSEFVMTVSPSFLHVTLLFHASCGQVAISLRLRPSDALQA